CATRPNEREKASYIQNDFLPIQTLGKLNLIEGDIGLIPGVNLRLYNGHTGGQILTYVNYHGRTVVFAADLIPSAAHVPLPYIMAYDNQPLTTLQEKEAFLKEAVAGNYVLFFVHDIYNECARLHMSEKGVRVKETVPFKSLT
ncbi:MAG: MBL fold metallo-hydrolase, partial [Ignavibacteria bacterium]|nr:MBL fold metallo-hydrolase [Ignavibacteria bacterium]